MGIKNDEHDTPVFPGGIPLQVARWSGKRISMTFGAGSGRVVIPAGSQTIELTAAENCFIAFGDVTVVASSTIATDGSRLFLAGVQAVSVPLDTDGIPFTHVAAIQQTVAGILQVEQLG